MNRARRLLTLVAVVLIVGLPAVAAPAKRPSPAARAPAVRADPAAGLRFSAEEISLFGQICQEAGGVSSTKANAISCTKVPAQPAAPSVTPEPLPAITSQAAKPRPEPAADPCAGLKITNIEAAPQGMIFTVQNSAARSAAFRIHYRGIQSSRLQISGRASKPFGVATQPVLSAMARAAALARGEGDGLINDCVFF